MTTINFYYLLICDYSGSIPSATNLKIQLTSSDSEIAKLHVHLEQQSAEHVRSREEGKLCSKSIPFLGILALPFHILAFHSICSLFALPIFKHYKEILICEM